MHQYPKWKKIEDDITFHNICELFNDLAAKFFFIRSDKYSINYLAPEVWPVRREMYSIKARVDK